MLVYVKSIEGLPLMPTNIKKARKLLSIGKAKIVSKQVFTIQLLYHTTSYTQPLCHKVDTGSKTIGSAVVDSNNCVLYISEVEIRNDISEKMKQRSISFTAAHQMSF